MPSEEVAAVVDRAIAEDRPLDAIRLYRCTREHSRELPSPAWRERAAEAALAASDRAHARGRIELALRHSSLATILSDQNAWLRRHTEQLRLELLPTPLGPAPARRF
jgi:hypothetical protein